jgi:hypothetical protein
MRKYFSVKVFYVSIFVQIHIFHVIRTRDKKKKKRERATHRIKKFLSDDGEREEKEEKMT